MTQRRHESGFTAVELLITLFVAAAFLIAGYQLFSVVVRDGGATRAESRASNIAYDYLRTYEAQATVPCTAQSPATNNPITVEGVVDATLTVAITCPNASTPDMSKVEVTIQYNNPREQVKHANYVNGTTSSSIITNGMIGWWQLNGGATNSSTSGNGTVVNATSTAGQNGLAGNAYNFAGNGYITASIPAIDRTSYTATLWFKASTSNDRKILSTSSSHHIIQIMPGGVLRTCLTSCAVGTTDYANNAWHFAAAVGDATGTRIYVDGSPTAEVTLAYSGTMSLGTQLRMGADLSPNFYFVGDIDDVRLYNRALNATEISTTYSGGGR